MVLQACIHVDMIHFFDTAYHLALHFNPACTSRLDVFVFCLAVFFIIFFCSVRVFGSFEIQYLLCTQTIRQKIAG